MDFDLSDDQTALRDAARDLLDKECGSPAVRAAADRDGFDADLWASMVAQGWTGIAVPEADGGVGLGTVEVAVLLEQAGAHLAPVPLAQQLLALEVAATTDWGPGLLAGEQVACVARTSLTRHPDGSVSGRPEPVVYGARAHVLVAPAGDELVAVDLRGVERAPEPAMDRTREVAWIHLDHAPATTVGDAAAVAQHLDRGAVYHAAACVAANHVVALMGQVERLAAAIAVPREAYGELTRAAVDNAVSLGAAEALTGPAARGDDATIARHLSHLPADERASYEAMMREARRLAEER